MNQTRRWKSICFAILLTATATASRAQTFTVLFDFNGSNGATPGPAMQLVQGLDGYLWGTTTVGGTAGVGTIFRVNPITSFLTTMYSFNSADAYEPWGGLALAPNGVFYRGHLNMAGRAIWAMSSHSRKTDRLKR